MRKAGFRLKAENPTILHSRLLHIVIVCALGIVVYSNTFDVPFHFDDRRNIADNPLVKDFVYFVNSSEAERLSSSHPYLYAGYRQRYIGHLTFALNYRVNGLEVAGYHAVNLAVHVINALLLYLLAILTFRTPHFAGSPLGVHSRTVALFSSLLFVSHPVQTQAVTYIVQRVTSLATMFYLLSLVLYVKARLSTAPQAGNSLKSGNKKTGAVFFYCFSLLSAVLAMKIKQIAFTLPVAIALYEFMFFRDNLKRRALFLVPLLLTMLVIPLTVMDADMPLIELVGKARELPETEHISRHDYLLTELRVVVTYLRLLVFPVNQNLDYDYPVFNSFFKPQVLLSFLFLLGVFGFGVYMLKRSKKHAAGRLVAFGIFWFFLALSVESSIIPLNPIYEHRVYLPSAGFFLAVMGAVVSLSERFGTRRLTVAVALGVITLSVAAYARNGVWQSEIRLWEDIVRKSSHIARPHNNLGSAYMSAGLYDKAEEHFNMALAIRPDYALPYNSLARIYETRGLTDRAVQYYRIALRYGLEYIPAHFGLGTAYFNMGEFDKAVEQYRIVLDLKPGYAEAHNALGNAYFKKGMLAEALKYYMTALRLRNDYAEAHFNTGVIYLIQGSTELAEKHFYQASVLRPLQPRDYIS
jgi:Flp pilus assembly protein TadD